MPLNESERLAVGLVAATNKRASEMADELIASLQAENKRLHEEVLRLRPYEHLWNQFRLLVGSAARTPEPDPDIIGLSGEDI